MVSFPNKQPFCQSIKTQRLPYASLLFLNDDVLVAAGYDFVPDIFQKEQRKWKRQGSADLLKEKPPAQEKEDSKFSGPLKRFQRIEVTGTLSRGGSTDLKSKHQNTITDLRIYGAGNHLEADCFSSSGHDGHIVVWKSKDLHNAVPNIRV